MEASKIGLLPITLAFIKHFNCVSRMERAGDNVCKTTPSTHSPYYGLTIDCNSHSRLEDISLVSGGGSEVPTDMVVIRPVFAEYIKKRIGDIAKLYDVDMNLQKVENEWRLSSVGAKAKESIHEALNAARRSKVYNYYLCLPLRATALNEKLLLFHNAAKQKLGGCVNFVKRPHVTLALLNLVTDSDIDAIVKALNEVRASLGFLQGTPQGLNMVANINGLDTILRKGKAKPSSVLMAKVDFDETAKDVIKCYQDAVNRAFNKILKLEPKRRLKRGKLDAPTESEGGANGIHITKSGQIEITYTDTLMVDKNAKGRDLPISNQEICKSSDHKATQTDHRTYQIDFCNPLEHHTFKREAHAVKDPESCEDDQDVEYGYSYDYDRSNPYDFHMTILRHAQVESLAKHEFEVQVPLHCVELRPRHEETCMYRAYTTNDFSTHCGQRHDGINVDAENQGDQGDKERIPLHLTDVLASQADDGDQGFIFTF